MCLILAWRCGGLQIDQNGAKIGNEDCLEHIITYYEAKWDFKVLKMHILLVKLVFYLKISQVKSICLTGVSPQGPYKSQKEQHRPKKEPEIQKISYCKAKHDFQVSKIYSWSAKLVLYLTSKVDLDPWSLSFVSGIVIKFIHNKTLLPSQSKFCWHL